MQADEATPLTTKASPPPFYVYFITFCASLNSVNLGFDIGVNSGVALLVQEDLHLSDWQVGIFMGSLHFVAAFGGFSNHFISDRWGRCKTFTVAQIFCIIGIVVLCLAESFEALLAGRLFLGVGIGVSLAIDPMYIAEVAPAAHRGALTTWSEISINLGILLGFVVNWHFSELPLSVGWRVMIASGAVLPIVVLILSLTVMPESPRWLLMRNRSFEAKEVLQRCNNVDEDISAQLSEIQRQLEVDAKYAQLGWSALLRPDKVTKRMVMVGIGVAFAQQINGSESIVLYAPEIFQQAGVATNTKDLFAVTMVVGFVKVIFIVISACVLDSVGRRPLLILSTFAMSSCEFLLSAGLMMRASKLAATAVFLFTASFAIGIGPIAWLLAAEVFPVHVRAKALSLAAFTNRLTSSFVALTFLPLANALSLAGYFLLFGTITLGTMLWAYLVVPETKQRTLEELTDHFRDLSDASDKTP